MARKQPKQSNVAQPKSISGVIASGAVYCVAVVLSVLCLGRQTELSACDGGYRCASKQFTRDFGAVTCSVERATDMTVEEFNAKFLNKKPVLLSREAPLFKLNHEEWTKSALLRDRNSVKVGTNESLARTGTGDTTREVAATVKDWSDSRSKYLFEVSTSHGRIQQLWSENLLPAYFKSSEYSPVFAAGQEGTGIPFHQHYGAFIEVLFGRKRWALYPPSASPKFSPSQSHSGWISHVLPTLSNEDRESLQECVQHPNEVMYVPQDWYHAVLNLGETVAIGGQMKAGDGMSSERIQMHKLLEKNKFEEAFEEAARLASKYKQSSHFPEAAGDIFFRQGQLEMNVETQNQEAVAQKMNTAAAGYRKALSINPLNLELKVKLAKAMLYLPGEKEAFSGHCESTMAEDPENDQGIKAQILQLLSIYEYQRGTPSAWRASIKWAGQAYSLGMKDVIGMPLMGIAQEAKRQGIAKLQNALERYLPPDALAALA
jgi:hypothetical protein